MKRHLTQWSLALFAGILLACSGSSLLPPQKFSAGQPGQILFLDDFSNPSSGWDTWNDNLSMVAYQDGVLRFLINQPNSDYWSRPRKSFTDVRLEVDVTRVAGPDNNDFGLICRFSDRDNFYAFLISSDRYAGIVRIQEGVYTVISSPNMQYNKLIQPGYVTHHLGAGCVQSNLTLYINGEKALEAQDLTHTAGEVGLMAGTYEQPGIDIIFDNFIAKSP